MEMHQVRYFLALAEDLNFTRAAARCHVSQPSLTRAIKLLEDELGGPLLRRERGNTHLSELGTMMLPYIREVNAQAEAAKKQAETFKQVAQRRLRLGVMCTIAPDPLLSLVTAINTGHPDVDLEIIDAPARPLEDALLAGHLDVALYCLPDARDAKLHYLKVFRERMVIALHPNDPLAARTALRLTDLNEQRYLSRANCEFRGADVFETCGATWQAVYRSERDDWILSMVAAGMGFSFLPEYSVRHPGVVWRNLVDPEVTREVDLVTVRGRPYSAAVGAVVREVMRNGWGPSRPGEKTN